MLLMVLTQPIGFAQKRAKTQSLTEEQRIFHVLNRLGFGARPGDVEAVRRTGLARYVDEQLGELANDPEAGDPDAHSLAIVRGEHRTD